MSSLGQIRATSAIVRRPRLEWRRVYLPTLLVVILLVVYIALNGGVFTSIAALGIANNALPLALVAVGETFVILTNGIDLSVGSVVTLGNVIVAGLGGHGLAGEGVVVALAAGVIAGLANGLIVCYARIAPLITTLATSSILLGIALIVMPSPGGAIPMWLANTTTGQLGNIPVAAIWLVGAIVAGWLVFNRTRFGINLRALGGSERSAWSAGIKVTRVRLVAYVAAGFFSALAGVVLAGLTQGGDPTIGAVYLLDAIAAAVVGGTSLVGGIGTLAGPVLGAIALSLISAVLQVSGISTNYQYIVTGAIVIAALLGQSIQANVEDRLFRRRLARTGSSAPRSGP